MTIIDTTLYANGALRLSRHGAGKGGNVLTLVSTGEQTTLSDAIVQLVDETLTRWDSQRADYDADSYFKQIVGWHGWSSESAMTSQSPKPTAAPGWYHN